MIDGVKRIINIRDELSNKRKSCSTCKHNKPFSMGEECFSCVKKNNWKEFAR